MWTTRAVYTLVMQRINFELHKYSIRILWTNHVIPWGALEAFFSINCAKLTWSPLHSHSYYIFPRPAPASPKFQHIDHSFQMFQVKQATYLQIGNWRSKYFWFWIRKIMFCQLGYEIIFFSSRVSRIEQSEYLVPWEAHFHVDEVLYWTNTLLLIHVID